MTYADTIDSDRHNVGFYVAFDGIEARLATHDMAAVGLSGTYYHAIIKDTVSIGRQRLDPREHTVQPAGVSFAVADADDVRALIVRRGTEDRLAAALDDSETDVELEDSAFADAAYVYVGTETIQLGTESGGTYSASDRGEFDSVATEHPEGATVSDAPRHWAARRATLYAVNLDDGTSAAVATFRLAQEPRHTDGVWSFSGVDVLSDLNRPLLAGWTEQRALDAPAAGSLSVDLGVSVPAVYFTVEDARHLMGGSKGTGACRLAVGDKVGYLRLYDAGINTTTGVVKIALSAHIGGHRFSEDEVIGAQDVTIKQVIFCNYPARIVALGLMLSKTGATSNTIYDYFPGRAPDGTDDAGWLRSGAGLDSSDVDTSSWLDVGGHVLSFFIEESTTLFQVLRDEILWRAGGYAKVDASGQLAFQRYESATVVGELDAYDTTDDVVLTAVDSHDTETGIPTRAEVEIDYDAATRQYRRKLEVSFPEYQSVYGLGAANTISIKSRSARNLSAAEVRASMQRLAHRADKGGRIRRVRFSWALHQLMVPGYRFALTSPYLPDHEGALGVSSAPHEVISVALDAQALTVTVEAEQLEQRKLIAPAFSVASYSLGTISIDTNGTDADYWDTTPGQYFPVGCTVRIYDMGSSPYFGTSQTTTVDAVAANSIQIDTSGLSFTPASGDIVVLEHSANATAAVANGANVQDYAFMADANGKISAGEAYETDADRWA